MSEAFVPDETPVDFFLLDGKASPGIVKFKGISAPRKWDERTAPGLGGALLVFLGNKLAAFSAEIYLTQRADYVGWHEFVPSLLRPPQGTRPKSRSFWHPYTAQLGIKAVEIESVTALEEVDTGHMVTVNFKEYNKLKLQLSKPAEPKPENAPLSPEERIIQSNTERIRELNRANEPLGATPPP